MKSVTEQYVLYLEEKQQQIPKDVIKKAKECLLDYIAVAYAGAHQSSCEMEPYLRQMSKEGNVSCIGIPVCTDVHTAAFINGFNSHLLELDDGHQFAMMHLASPIISAILAVAQKEKVSGIDILRGIVIGYEAAVKLAISIQPSHKQNGFHTSGTCGTIGAAVGCGILLKADRQQMKTTISAAITSASGLLAIQDDNSKMKPYNTGQAAMNGVNAAYMGLTGLTTPEDIIQGKRGIFKVLAKDANERMLTEPKNYYEIERIYIKPYAACRHCHSAMEAAMLLRSRVNISVNEIEKIEVYTYKMAVIGHNYVDIRGSSAAKLSIPFSVAVSYITGNGGVDAFLESSVLNSEIIALTKKIRVYEEKEFSDLSPKQRVARVKLIDRNGQEYCEKVDYAKGDPQNPLTLEELEKKYNSLMEFAGKNNYAEEMLNIIKKIEVVTEDFYNCIGGD